VEIEHGVLIGKVREVMRTGGVELLVVEDESGRERLIPMAQAIVIDIDLAQRKIMIDPPEGLLDL
jgi:16S rRNA processing protein RimM